MIRTDPVQLPVICCFIPGRGFGGEGELAPWRRWCDVDLARTRLSCSRQTPHRLSHFNDLYCHDCADGRRGSFAIN